MKVIDSLQMLQKYFAPIFIDPLENFPSLSDMSETAQIRCKSNPFFVNTVQDQPEITLVLETTGSPQQPNQVRIVHSPKKQDKSIEDLLCWLEMKIGDPQYIRNSILDNYKNIPQAELLSRLHQIYKQIDLDEVKEGLSSSVAFCKLLRPYDDLKTIKFINIRPNKTSARIHFKMCITLLKQLGYQNDYDENRLSSGNDIIQFLKSCHDAIKQEESRGRYVNEREKIKPIEIIQEEKKEPTPVYDFVNLKKVEIDSCIVQQYQKFNENLTNFFLKYQSVLDQELLCLGFKKQRSQSVHEDQWRNGQYFKQLFYLLTDEAMKSTRVNQDVLSYTNDINLTFRQIEYIYTIALPDPKIIVKGSQEEIYLTIFILISIYHQKRGSLPKFMSAFQTQDAVSQTRLTQTTKALAKNENPTADQRQTKTLASLKSLDICTPESFIQEFKKGKLLQNLYNFLILTNKLQCEYVKNVDIQQLQAVNLLIFRDIKRNGAKSIEDLIYGGTFQDWVAYCEQVLKIFGVYELNRQEEWNQEVFSVEWVEGTDVEPVEMGIEWQVGWEGLL